MLPPLEGDQNRCFFSVKTWFFQKSQMRAEGVTLFSPSELVCVGKLGVWTKTLTSPRSRLTFSPLTSSSLFFSARVEEAGANESVIFIEPILLFSPRFPVKENIKGNVRSHAMRNFFFFWGEGNEKKEVSLGPVILGLKWGGNKKGNISPTDPHLYKEA